MRRFAALIAIATFTVAPAWAQKPPAGKDEKAARDPKEVAKEADLKIRTLLNAAGPQLDACTERYLVEYPNTNGKADINLVVLKSGVVEKVTVDVALEGARNLKPCLEQVGKGLKFPEASQDGASLKITVPIKKGEKFRVPMPGEEPPKGEEVPSENGFVQFLPADWTPQ